MSSEGPKSKLYAIPKAVDFPPPIPPDQSNGINQRIMRLRLFSPLADGLSLIHSPQILLEYASF